MKPDWKYAPEWAKWLAMDGDGKWGWYEFEPTIRYSQWSCISSEGRQEFIERPSPWQDTKEARP